MTLPTGSQVGPSAADGNWAEFLFSQDGTYVISVSVDDGATQRAGSKSVVVQKSNALLLRGTMGPPLQSEPWNGERQRTKRFRSNVMSLASSRLASRGWNVIDAGVRSATALQNILNTTPCVRGFYFFGHGSPLGHIALTPVDNEDAIPAVTLDPQEFLFMWAGAQQSIEHQTILACYVSSDEWSLGLQGLDVREPSRKYGGNMDGRTEHDALLFSNHGIWGIEEVLPQLPAQPPMTQRKTPMRAFLPSIAPVVGSDDCTAIYDFNALLGDTTRTPFTPLSCGSAFGPIQNGRLQLADPSGAWSVTAFMSCCEGAGLGISASMMETTPSAPAVVGHGDWREIYVAVEPSLSARFLDSLVVEFAYPASAAIASCGSESQIGVYFVSDSTGYDIQPDLQGYLPARIDSILHRVTVLVPRPGRVTLACSPATVGVAPGGASGEEPTCRVRREAGEVVIELEVAADTQFEANVHDVTGRRVWTHAAARIGRGRHTIRWNGVGMNGLAVGKGIYFLTARAGGRRWDFKVPRP